MNTIPKIDSEASGERTLPSLGMPKSPREPVSDYWQRVLSGQDLGLQRLQHWFLKLPSAPRCGLCCVPFGSWGGIATRVLSRQPASGSAMLCRRCQEEVEQNPGSAPLEATYVVADFRERQSVDDTATDWIRPFVRSAVKSIGRREGIVEAPSKRGLGAFFIPWRAGAGHAEQAILAARDLFAVAKEHALERHGVQLAVGLHSGPMRVGAVKKGPDFVFGAVGPAVNTASQLAAAATAGEALISLAAWRQQGGPVAKSRHRTVPLPGALQPVEAIVLRGDIEAAL